METSTGGGRMEALWSQMIAVENEENQQPNRIQIAYQRRKRKTPHESSTLRKLSSVDKENRVSFVEKRVSWNRSLSIRGRISIAVSVCAESQFRNKPAKRKGRPPVPKGKAIKLANFEKEREYFKDVDAFELLEESPSPKNFWTKGDKTDTDAIPHLTSRLEKWLISKKLKFTCGPSSTLSKILGTPNMSLEATYDNSLSDVNVRTDASLKTNSGFHSLQRRVSTYLLSRDLLEKDSDLRKSSILLENLQDEDCGDNDFAVKKLSLTSSASLEQYADSFNALLAVCGQSAPSTMVDVFSKYCDPENIVKVGEGTYGEAFKAGNTVCKVVPIDGDLKINGEPQKKSEELLEEAVLSQTLNLLRGNGPDARNSCTTFIETLDISICRGSYDSSLIRAWEDWDEKNGSENDHPKEFPEKQCYVVFVLQHGGKDLESFVLLNFDEARSLLVQVTAALAVAEAEYEFEHRDLHWGNVLLSRTDSTEAKFTLEGKNLQLKTFGISISIIDFTLSRINTGEDILYLDLSSDPYLFKGPKGDRQAETYRRMKAVTEDFWEGSFPKTNVLWLLYLVDILLLKKSFDRSMKNERELRALKKNLEKYNSAKEAIFDPFFSDMFAAES